MRQPVVAAIPMGGPFPVGGGWTPRMPSAVGDGSFPDGVVELIARRFRLLSEPMRIRLLDRLRDGEATVHELADELGAAEQNIITAIISTVSTGITHIQLEPAKLLPATPTSSIWIAMNAMTSTTMNHFSFPFRFRIRVSGE